MSTISDVPGSPGGAPRPARGRRRLLAGLAAALGAGALAAGLVAWNASRGSAAPRSITSGVVDVTTTQAYQDATAAGTGMVLSASGVVLTNNHVVQGASRITVTDVTTGRRYQATVLGTDAADDVALLQLKGASGLSTVDLGHSSDLSVGAAVKAIGNANGDGGAPTISSGRVTRLDQAITVSDPTGQDAEHLTGLIQVSARLQPGESGGPLVDSAGEVVGMNTATSVSFRFASSTSQGYAIPIDTAMSIAKQIQAGQGSSRVHIGAAARLGVQVAGSDGPYGPSVRGALVEGVASGTPADTADLQPGDTIVSLGGRVVTSADSLKSVINLHHPGDRVQVRWVDQAGQSHSATVTLATGPPA